MVTKAGVTIAQFAEDIGVAAERLLSQLKEAGIPLTHVEYVIHEAQKQKLLQYLQQYHSASSSQLKDNASKIVLRRAKTSAIKVGGTHAVSGKMISVQVRKKRTYIKQITPQITPEVAPVVATDGTVAAEPTMASPQATTASSATIPAASASTTATAIQVPTETIAATEDTKDKLTKRKLKHHDAIEEEFAATTRHKKKKKGRSETGHDENRGFEALLSRGADLKRVLTVAEEEADEMALRRAQRIRATHLAKIKVQAFVKPTTPIVREVNVPEIIALTELASRLSVKAAEVIKVLMKMGTIATINQMLDQETAILVVEEMGHRAIPVHDNAMETALAQSLTVEGTALPRPPVITIMGHVDHGKTTLLDYIRTTKVAASEAGGITQHIGAYHVQIPKGTITFLDTPGHAAFTAMRARGAKLTDIVILVVAAEDGVMPQTIEAIQHAQAANVPLVVAINKMDKPDADPDRVKQALTQYHLVPEEWGGETMFVPISAKTGMGVDQLLDSVLVQAEILELTAVVDCLAKGVVIESRLDKKRGTVMSVLVQQGTLKPGDIMLVGSEYGRVRMLFDEHGVSVPSAGPAIPVEVLGITGFAQAGDDFVVMLDEKQAREVALHRQAKNRAAKLAKQAVSVEDAFKQIASDQAAQNATINLIIKADVQGSVEALKQALTELSDETVAINIVASGMGGINENDVNLAMASHAMIIAFNVRANSEARKLMEAQQVGVHYHNIIYDAIDQVKQAKRGRLAPIMHEKVLGVAEVRDVFRSSKIGAVAGCMVLEGVMKRHLLTRILRDNVVIFESTLESLRRFKDDVAEVRNGMECGLSIKNYHDIKVGDRIEVFERVEIEHP